MSILQGKKVAALVVAAVTFASAARAMTIHDFGRMNNDDESTYVALMITESAKLLKAQGQPDKAAELMAYFKEPGKFGGVQQFAAQLMATNANNKRNAINPNNRVPEAQIEDAMEKTLKDKGYIVPAKYLRNALKDFRPDGPPRARAPGEA
jgi:hypothetical protein